MTPSLPTYDLQSPNQTSPDRSHEMPKTSKGRPLAAKRYHVPAVLLTRNSSIILAIAIFYVTLVFADESKPISPGRYQKLIGPGFATNWFKTKEPMKKYSEQNIKDVRDKGFKNLRLRCRADLYSYDYTATNFTWFLGNLTTVVDHCLKHKVIPIVSWIHHHAEAYATEEDHNAYVAWWTAVAQQLKDKDLKLGFNLFTELGIDECGANCDESLRKSIDKYNNWTTDVVAAIRGTGGNNAHRILILGSPGKTAKDLENIESTIYSNDSYMMAEWHIYASGPNKKKDGQKYWKGNGTAKGQENVRNAIYEATNFTKKFKLRTYLGAWMPQDNKDGDLNEDEVVSFARFIVTELGSVNIPWSLNVLDRYYDTKQKTWLTEKQNIQGRNLNMSRVLDNIREVMP